MSDVVQAGGRLDMGAVASRTFGFIGGNLPTLAAAGLLLGGVPSLIGFMAGGAGGGAVFEPGSGVGAALGILGGVLLALIGAYLLQAAVIRMTVGAFRGQTVSIGSALTTSFAFILPLFLLGLLIGLGVFAGLLLLLVPGLFLAVRWSVAAPALVVENAGIFGSMARSRDLIRGSGWTVFLLFLIYFVLVGVVQMVGSAVGVLGGTVFTAVVTVLLGAATSILSACGIAALYWELRVTKEGAGDDEIAAAFD